MRLLLELGLSEAVELRDHIDWALFRSKVDGAEEDRTESNASRPTRSLPIWLKSRAHTVGTKSVGSLAICKCN